MPIPFRLSDEIETLGEAAFLQLEPQSRREMRGALLFLNALGEPKEFVYNRIRLDAAELLWRPEDRHAGAARRLTVSLLEAALGRPRLLFCRADQVGAEIFGGSGDFPVPARPAAMVSPGIPAARLAPAAAAPSDGTRGSAVAMLLETFDAGGDALALAADWAQPPGPPEPDTDAALLVNMLAVRGLLWEPFERAAVGLAEAYGAATAVR